MKVRNAELGTRSGGNGGKGEEKGPRIIAGLSIGESGRRTTLAIVTATGKQPEINTTCVFVMRYRLATTFPTIADSVGGILKLDRLREELPALRPAEFDNAKCELVMDISLAGAAVFQCFGRARKDKRIDVDQFVALQITNGAVLSAPEYREGAKVFRIPKADLAAVMQMALDPAAPLFHMHPTVASDLRDTFRTEMQHFRGRGSGGEGEVVVDPRERPSDDILLAVMCAVWQANQVQPEFILESLGPPSPGWERGGGGISDLHPLNIMRIKYGGGGRKYW
jgi:hypothetical protein